ncbi:hypothetical protein E2C01_092259 [Portunus trituberculatus]|uniref:Uncharacterized protein n=1 Tax=Portunus trituberculatus TaxID=210409 RepID=A0A5B7JXA0_PORTR|nr:hypothetical protein [Portunus trituberculatus]
MAMMSGARVRSLGAAANDGPASHSSHVCGSGVTQHGLRPMHNDADPEATPPRHSHRRAGGASSGNE